jgi:predicted dehydrogenase
MQRPFNVAIVGAGTIGAVHAAALAKVAEARLVAVAEPREAAGRALAEEHGADWHGELGEVLARPDVEVVVLATPSGLHAEQAVAAAGAGKHVVAEKPMATTLDDADRMIAACRAAGVHLAVIFQSRLNRDALRLKRAVDAGLFGRPVLGSAVVPWKRTQAYYDESGGWRGTWKLDGGGALMNQSIHTIDLLQWVLGPVERISAETATLTHRIETEDTAAACLRFAGGALGVIQGTTSASRNWPVRLEVVGTEGRAFYEGGKLSDWQPNRAVEDAELLSAEELALTADWRGDEPFGVGHERQFRAIFAALRRGEEPPVPGEEARAAVEIILAIYRAATSGAAVALGGER